MRSRKQYIYDQKPLTRILFHPSSVHAITRSLTPRIPTLSTNLPPTSSTTSASASASLTNPSTSASLSSTTSTSTTTTAIPLSTSTSNTLPNPSLPLTGLEVLETEKFRLSCFQTITGIKFLLFTDPLMANVDVVMKKVYELYADYVMKNPFYQLEMPVRCEAFDRNLGSWLKGRA
ncbi:hypothetical protein AJ80_05842 [Polytolypa hystricis UAMH7299]|uniref:Trafficking protein particle complex subunit n=1 Tax=Polytolypa hystricis (strain UAMH7299) TaxID=1447883 RepID=A0A2B7Y0U8_POLH7|nr:hypothetical protein AJ80_05842 [Polytolypa hystricis UAMH7299]